MAYSIKVERRARDGTLSFDSGAAHVSTTCWWDLSKPIPAGTYHKCSATKMATRLNSKGNPREGIVIPDVPGFSGIFIHMGTSPDWSNGCIVIDEDEVLKIWNAITPKDGFNVDVQVIDVPIPPGGCRYQ
jgi:hypothetical protein